MCKDKCTNRDKIIEAAEQIIIEKGVKNTSLADIAREVGISKGTLYYHYSSKDSLIYDIAERHLEQTTDHLMTWIEQIQGKVTPEDIMKTAFEKVANDTTRGRLHLYLMQEVVTGNEELKQRFVDQYKTWRMTIESGLEKVLGEHCKSKDLLADIMLAALDGYTIHSLLGIESKQYLEISKLLVKGSLK